MNENIFELLRIDNTISVNRKIAHEIGLDAAIVYGALLAKYFWYKERNMLDDEDMFFCTLEDLFESTTLQRKKQDNAISILKYHGLIETKRKGIPSKRYFKINLDINIISKILTKNADYYNSLSERDNLECPNGTNNNVPKGQLNIYNKTNANKTVNINVQKNFAQETFEKEFEDVWKDYPNKKGKTKAKASYIKARKEGETKENILEGIRKYKAEITARQIEHQYIKNGDTWFRNKCWLDEYYEEPATKTNANSGLMSSLDLSELQEKVEVW